MSLAERSLVLVAVLGLAVGGCGKPSSTPAPTPGTGMAATTPGGVSTAPPPAGHRRDTRPDSKHGMTRKLEPTTEMEPAVEARYESVFEPAKR
jgi:hypothetical protein